MMPNKANKAARRRNRPRVLLVLLATAIITLSACGQGADSMPRQAATALSGDGFATATSYDDIHSLILGGVPASTKARPDALPAGGNDTSAADALDAAVAADGNEAGYVQEAETSKPPLEVAGITQASLTATGDGYTYVGEREGLEVHQGSASGEVSQSINLYDYTNAGGQVVSLALGADTLAALYVTDAGLFYSSTDYALAAYAAPRAIVLFFDTTDTAKTGNLTFIKAIGVSGIPKAVYLQGENLFVACSHAATPNVGADGNWELDGREPSEVKGYTTSLALRSADAVAFVPGYFDDGNLEPLDSTQLYISEYGLHTTWTVVGAFSLSTRSCASLFALLDPGVPSYSNATVGTGGFTLMYAADYNGAPALVTLTAPALGNGTMPGLGSISWTNR